MAAFQTISPCIAQLGVKLTPMISIRGAVVSSITSGDVNGDTYDDVIISTIGRVYVVYGRPKEQESVIVELTSLEADDGFVLSLRPGTDYAPTIACADVSGDGISDVLIGAYAENGTSFRSGKVYVVYGIANVSRGFFDLEDLEQSSGYTVVGAEPHSRTGWAIAVGDVNGDGIGDIVISAPDASPLGRSLAGLVYVLYGTTVMRPTANLASMTTDGYVLYGESPSIRAGSSVTTGDVNGDGIVDILIGSPYAPVGMRLDAGLVSVVYGCNSSRLSMDLLGLDIDDGYVIYGAWANGLAGGGLISSDVNGDAIDDVIIDGPYIYVLYGVVGCRDSIQLSTLHQPDGYYIYAATHDCLICSSDVNDDGIDDIILGHATASTLYVFYGSDDVYRADIYIGTRSRSGYSLNGYAGDVWTGDVNGDGIADVIMSQQGGIAVFLGQSVTCSPYKGVTEGYEVGVCVNEVYLGSTCYAKCARDYSGDAVWPSCRADGTWTALSGCTKLDDSESFAEKTTAAFKSIGDFFSMLFGAVGIVVTLLALSSCCICILVWWMFNVI